MKLARFNTLLEAETKLAEISLLAKSPSSSEPFMLTSVNESADGSFFWFVFDRDCLVNAGTALTEIQAKESELTITETDAIPSGWEAVTSSPT